MANFTTSEAIALRRRVAELTMALIQIGMQLTFGETAIFPVDDALESARRQFDRIRTDVDAARERAVHT